MPSHEYTLDKTYDFEHALSNATNGPGYVYDMVIYGPDYTRLYIELDGPGHVTERDRDKKARADKAKASFERFSFRDKSIYHRRKRMSDDDLFAIIDAKLRKPT